MFRTVPLSIIRSLFIVHSAMVYVIHVCRQISSRTCWSCSKAVYKPIWHIPLLSVKRINSWWWTCRVSCQNKFVKLVHLVGFIIKKYVVSYRYKWNPSSNYSAHSRWPEYFRSYCSIVTILICRWRWYTVVCGFYHNYQRVTVFQASATKKMKSEIFWVITQRVVVIS